MLYFIHESGHDHGASPYEVLAAVAVRERDLWNLIQAIRSAELELFGVALADVGIEFKGAKLLKKKTFRLANEGDPIAPMNGVSVLTICAFYNHQLGLLYRQPRRT